MQTPEIQITQSDYNRLQNLLRDPSKLRPDEKDCRLALSRELARAQIMPSNEIPGDVITLHSRARLVDLQTNEALELTIVLPEEIDVDAGRISIFAPLGTAMLGYRKGDVFEWRVPGGQSRFHVEDVIFQPEAADQINGAIDRRSQKPSDGGEMRPAGEWRLDGGHRGADPGDHTGVDAVPVRERATVASAARMANEE